MLGDAVARLAVVLSFDGSAVATGSTKAQGHLRKVHEAITSLDDRFVALGKTLSAGVTLPVAGIGAGVLAIAADFETAMNKVAISTQAGAGELREMSKLATKLGADTLFGASEAADAMDMLAKNGLSARQILDGAAQAAVNLATAAGSELAPAADAITDVMAQFKLSTAELSGVVDQITGAVNESKLDFADFALAIGQAGGVAGAVGVEFTDFNAVLAGTSSLFASGSDAGTSFKTFLTTLPGKSSPAKAAIAELGLQFYNANGSLRSMAEIADELREGLSGLSEEARQEALTTIFGTDAMRTAVGLMDLGAAGIERIKAAIDATDAGGQAAQRMNTLAGQLDNLRGAFESLAIAIAETGLLTAVTRIVSGFAGLVQRLAEANPVLLKVVVGAAGLAAALGPLMVVTGTLAAFALPLFITKLGVAGVALAALVNPLGTAVAFLAQFAIRVGGLAALGAVFSGLKIAMAGLFANPAFLAAAGVIAGIYLAWQNWDKIAPLFQPLVEELRALAEGLGLVEQKAGATNEELARTAPMRAFGAELLKTNDDLNTIADAFFSLEKAVGDWGVAIHRDYVAPASQAISEFLTLLETGANRAGVAIGNFVTRALDWVGRLASGVRDAIVGRLGATFAWLNDKLEAAGDWFFKLYDRVVGHSYVPDMVDGIADEMKRLDGEMVRPITIAASAADRAFRTMAANTRSVLNDLFPEMRELLDYREQIAAIDASKLVPAQKDEARRRAGVQFAEATQREKAPLPEFLRDVGPIGPSMEEVGKAIGELTRKAQVGTVQIAKSFKDMADETLSALSRLTSSIKGGGFLGILEAVIGLGLQLGSIGVFGSKIAGRINAPASVGSGTSLVPTASMVGRAGPIGAGASNDNPGRSLVEIVDTTGLFVTRVNGQIAQAAPGIAQAGASTAQTQIAYSQNRKWRG